MRLRVLLGGIAAALAVTAVTPASAAEVRPACADGFEILCYVICVADKYC
jgi:hypothetical protein